MEGQGERVLWTHRLGCYAVASSSTGRGEEAWPQRQGQSVRRLWAEWSGRRCLQQTGLWKVRPARIYTRTATPRPTVLHISHWQSASPTSQIGLQWLVAVTTATYIWQRKKFKRQRSELGLLISCWMIKSHSRYDMLNCTCSAILSAGGSVSRHWDPVKHRRRMASSLRNLEPKTLKFRNIPKKVKRRNTLRGANTVELTRQFMIR